MFLLHSSSSPWMYWVKHFYEVWQYVDAYYSDILISNYTNLIDYNLKIENIFFVSEMSILLSGVARV